MPMKAVLFDFWGTLAYNKYGHARHDWVLEIIGRKNRQYYLQLKREWGAKPWSTEEFFSRLVGRLGLEPGMVNKLVRVWEKQLSGCHLYPEVIPVLKKLKSMGLKIGLVSNTHPLTHKTLAILGVNKFFDSIVLSCDAGSEKPDPQIYLKALSELGVSAEKALFVGDQYVPDFEGPRQLGMKAMLVNRHKGETLEKVFSEINEQN